MNEWNQDNDRRDDQTENQIGSQTSSQMNSQTSGQPDPLYTAPEPTPVTLEPVAPVTPSVTPDPTPVTPVGGWTTPDPSAPSTPPAPPATPDPMVPPTQEGPTSVPPAMTYHYGPSSYPSSSQPTPHSPYTPVQPPYTPYGGWQPPRYQPPYGAPPTATPKKKNKGKVLVAFLVAACVVAIVALSVLLITSQGTGTSSPNSRPSSSVTPSPRAENPDAPSLRIVETEEDGVLATRSIVDMNINSTVVVNMWKKQSTSAFGWGFSSETQLVQAGTASGIVMTADGYIITNCHVVIDENTGVAFDRIDVQLYDGTVYENATIIGADEDTDLAVIRVDATDLIPAEFGDSSALHLGDKVVAIGNAGGLAWTVTQGIVSGLERDVYDDTGYSIKCLQVDAAINPGNSGGPLFNGQGQVVAVNSAKISATEYEGLGFAIPINEAKRIIDDLVRYGYVTGRIQLGITGDDINVSGYEGFRIRSINSDSCLISTEAQVGDIIKKVNDVTVTSRVELRAQLSKFNVGDTVTLTLQRIVNNRTGEYTVVTVNCTLTESNF